ncbi:hypothetical protein [Desulfosediminicola flagellatus]|uniref:hypothetical protein n=1 Tax=Desulfosediminicola flagellatus TaxID=2569541 RepID=UPI0010AB9B03|nr:hypothetical protein [Desulfosediminicola flagellatus]
MEITIIGQENCTIKPLVTHSFLGGLFYRQGLESSLALPAPAGAVVGNSIFQQSLKSTPE